MRDRKVITLKTSVERSMPPPFPAGLPGPSAGTSPGGVLTMRAP